MVWVCDLFILVWCLFALSWNLPSDFFAKRCVSKFKTVILWTGLWHGWSMFAPTPVQVEKRWSVRLTMKDGSIEMHDLFRIHEASKWKAFVWVRERKFQSVLSQKSSKSQRAAVCKYARRALTSDPELVAKSELIYLKRKIVAFTNNEDQEVEEKAVWQVTF